MLCVFNDSFSQKSVCIIPWTSRSGTEFGDLSGEPLVSFPSWICLCWVCCVDNNCSTCLPLCKNLSILVNTLNESYNLEIKQKKKNDSKIRTG